MESENTESSFLDTMEEEEQEEFQKTVEEYVNTYLEENMQKFSQETFTATMIHEITQELLLDLQSAGICNKEDENDVEDVENYVEEIVEHVYEMYDVPARSESVYDEPLYSPTEIIGLRDKIQKLQDLPLPAQRSSGWYAFRHQLFTASNLWKLFSTECQYNSLIYEKCLPINENGVSFGTTNLTSPAHWGIKYEPISVEIYKRRNQVEVIDLGCIQHPRHSFIGASPDGIVVSPFKMGRMLEIKNPVNREINRIPSEAYWIQMQLQMEVCDLDECDFLETQFREYPTESAFWEDLEKDQEKSVFDKMEKGVLLLIMKESTIMYERPIPAYIHYPLDAEITKENVELWITKIYTEKNEQTNEIEYKYSVTPIYWYLEIYSCVLVRRNKLWFESVVPIIESAWNTVLKEREEGYGHRAPKKKIKQLVPALFMNIHKLPTEYECEHEN